tara:strand:- start:14589 stop:15014 length:426 start_codon:yes stop_codon:yes gene_type:complete
MSSLNIDDLYETIDEKNNKRLEKFDGILKQIHGRIKYYSKLERTFCFFQIPEFIIGVPLYNVSDLRNYIINSLKRNGFHIVYIDPNWLYISWAKEDRGKPVKKTKPKKDKNYKLIDEYKPSGQFVNENDLSSIKMKSKQLF